MALGSIPRAGQVIWVKVASMNALRLILGQKRGFNGVLYNLLLLAVYSLVVCIYRRAWLHYNSLGGATAGTTASPTGLGGGGH